MGVGRVLGGIKKRYFGGFLGNFHNFSFLEKVPFGKFWDILVIKGDNTPNIDRNNKITIFCRMDLSECAV